MSFSLVGLSALGVLNKAEAAESYSFVHTEGGQALIDASPLEIREKVRRILAGMQGHWESEKEVLFPEDLLTSFHAAARLLELPSTEFLQENPFSFAPMQAELFVHCLRAPQQLKGFGASLRQRYTDASDKEKERMKENVRTLLFRFIARPFKTEEGLLERSRLFVGAMEGGEGDFVYWIHESSFSYGDLFCAVLQSNQPELVEAFQDFLASSTKEGEKALQQSLLFSLARWGTKKTLKEVKEKFPRLSIKGWLPQQQKEFLYAVARYAEPSLISHFAEAFSSIQDGALSSLSRFDQKKLIQALIERGNPDAMKGFVRAFPFVTQGLSYAEDLDVLIDLAHCTNASFISAFFEEFPDLRPVGELTEDFYYEMLQALASHGTAEVLTAFAEELPALADEHALITRERQCMVLLTLLQEGSVESIAAFRVAFPGIANLIRVDHKSQIIMALLRRGDENILEAFTRAFSDLGEGLEEQGALAILQYLAQCSPSQIIRQSGRVFPSLATVLQKESRFSFLKDLFNPFTAHAIARVDLVDLLGTGFPGLEQTLEGQQRFFLLNMLLRKHNIEMIEACARSFPGMTQELSEEQRSSLVVALAGRGNVSQGVLDLFPYLVKNLSLFYRKRILFSLAECGNRTLLNQISQLCPTFFHGFSKEDVEEINKVFRQMHFHA